MNCRCIACSHQVDAPPVGEPPSGFCSTCRKAGCDGLPHTKAEMLVALGNPRGWTEDDIRSMSPPPCTHAGATFSMHLSADMRACLWEIAKPKARFELPPVIEFLSAAEFEASAHYADVPPGYYAGAVVATMNGRMVVEPGREYELVSEVIERARVRLERGECEPVDGRSQS